MKRYLYTGSTMGCHDYLMQALEKANFDPMQDTIIHGGNIGDVGPQTVELMNFMCRLTHLYLVKGPRDVHLLNFLESAEVDKGWEMEGGDKTIQSYDNQRKTVGIDKETRILGSHIQRLNTAENFHYIMDLDCIAVHAGLYQKNVGFNHRVNYYMNPTGYMTDGELWQEAKRYHVADSKSMPIVYRQNASIFICHQNVYDPRWNPNGNPQKRVNIYNCNTGAGIPGGFVSVVDMDTKEVFKSRPIPKLYLRRIKTIRT